MLGGWGDRGLLAMVLGLWMTACGQDATARSVYSVTSSIPDIDPGRERTVCQVLDLGNEEPAVVRAIRADLSFGSHHMIVYRTDEEPTETPAPCGSLPVDENTLLIAQQSDTALELPDGAGLSIPAHQRVRVEIHYINYTDAPLDVEGSVHFETGPSHESVEPVEVLFMGSLSLELPPREVTTIDTFVPMPAGANVFALTSHTHQLGQYASLKRAFQVGDPDAELLHESHDWAEPPLDTFDPPLVFEPGEGLWLTCVFDNDTDETVTFGSRFDDEMCFLWAYWY